MLAIRNILVPRDFSPCSEQALQYALDLALRTKASIHTLFAEVLHSDPQQVPPDPDKEAAELRARLHLITRENPDAQFVAGAEDILVYNDYVRDVAPAPAILSYADEHEIDLIVMGTHGRRGLRRLLLGSVTEEVVRLSGSPVFTVRCRPESTSVKLSKGNILVPIDFSRQSLEALQHARELAMLYKATLTLAHIVEDRLHPAFYNAGVFSIYDVQPDIEERVALQLSDLRKQVIGSDITVNIEVRPGHAAHEIVEVASERDIDMIVMSTHGLTGLEHFFLGSVTEKVIRAAPCPVFTIRTSARSLLVEPVPPEFENPG